MKDRLLKNKKGITLIALVITIIVLLILAGISISMISSQDGILNKATTAKETQKKATEEEKVKLAVQAALADGEGTINIQDTTGDEKGSLKKALNSAGIDYTGTNGIITVNGINYKVTEDGKVNKKNFMGQNYGDSINYNGSTDWQIFYDDGTNVYLIAKNYVVLDEESRTTLGLESDENGYRLTWQTIPNYGKTYNSENCVEAFLDKTKWTSYKDNEGKAEYAIGASTLEMFIASYNEKYPNGANGILDYKKDGIGYKMRWKKTGNESYSTNVGGFESTDNMYVITSSSDADACWLATTYSEEALYCVFRENGFESEPVTGLYDCGIRPIICLKSGSSFEYDSTNKVWNIK